jgi:hypothetical protein
MFESVAARKNIAVLVPEVLAAPVATLGAVYCMQQIPKQMNWLSSTVSKHIVQPHLKTFEYFGKGLRKAHQEYDAKRNEERLARGEPIKKEINETPAERAFAISDLMVKALVALGADFTATYGLQRVLNKSLGAGIAPFKTAITESTVHLGVMALMPTMFAKFSEHVHFGLSKTMQNTLGTDKKSADERAGALTYVSMPGYVAAIASLLYAHSAGNKVRLR